MEHRHFPRKSIDADVQLITNEGKCYQARLLEHSAIGMRVMLVDKLPERVKLVNVKMPDSVSSEKLMRSVRMFVVRKEGCILGLCLLNENAKINLG